MTPLRYGPEIEHPAPDEQDAIDGIVRGITQQSEAVEAGDGAAVRASHAKSTACAVGTLNVPGDLAPELAQGLFARLGEYAAAVRFAQGPGERLGDRVSTHRGMAIKLFGVQGKKLSGHAHDTQDFVLASGTTFPSGTARGFLRDGTVIGKATRLPEAAKSAVSSAACGLNHLLHAFGTESAKADFFGHPFSHPDGRGAAGADRLGTVPRRDRGRVRQGGARLLPGARGGLRDQSAALGRCRAAADRGCLGGLAGLDQSIPDRRGPATVCPERWSEARRHYFDEVMTFRPGHSLAAHRPLGSVMRARLRVYEALSAFRHGETGIAEEEPTSVDRIPG